MRMSIRESKKTIYNVMCKMVQMCTTADQLNLGCYLLSIYDGCQMCIRHPNIYGEGKESTQKVQEVDEFIQKINKI